MKAVARTGIYWAPASVKLSQANNLLTIGFHEYTGINCLLHRTKGGVGAKRIEPKSNSDSKGVILQISIAIREPCERVCSNSRALE